MDARSRRLDAARIALALGAVVAVLSLFFGDALLSLYLGAITALAAWMLLKAGRFVIRKIKRPEPSSRRH
jgi:O-antigen/teichoic acid export membrane protein